MSRRASSRGAFAADEGDINICLCLIGSCDRDQDRRPDRSHQRDRPLDRVGPRPSPATPSRSLRGTRTGPLPRWPGSSRVHRGRWWTSGSRISPPSMRPARPAADDPAGKPPRLDLLVNNAGVLLARSGRSPPRAMSETLATNLLSPLALTEALLPALKAAAPVPHRHGRVIEFRPRTHRPRQSGTRGRLVDGAGLCSVEARAAHDEPGAGPAACGGRA